MEKQEFVFRYICDSVKERDYLMKCSHTLLTEHLELKGDYKTLVFEKPSEGTSHGCKLRPEDGSIDSIIKMDSSEKIRFIETDRKFLTIDVNNLTLKIFYEPDNEIVLNQVHIEDEDGICADPIDSEKDSYSDPNDDGPF